jgi:signal transduction histidine kinase
MDWLLWVVPVIVIGVYLHFRSWRRKQSDNAQSAMVQYLKSIADEGERAFTEQLEFLGQKPTVRAVALMRLQCVLFPTQGLRFRVLKGRPSVFDYETLVQLASGIALQRLELDERLREAVKQDTNEAIRRFSQAAAQEIKVPGSSIDEFAQMWNRCLALNSESLGVRIPSGPLCEGYAHQFYTAGMRVLLDALSD